MGPLRGQSPPSREVLERLAALCSRFVVSFTPATDGRPPRWWIHETLAIPTVVDADRRAAGVAKLHRATKWVPEAKERRRAELWDAEAMVAGLYYVGDYSVEEFGGDWMFAELVRGQALVQSQIRQHEIDAARESEGKADVEAEEIDNPGFREYVRDVAMDWYPQIIGTKHIAAHGLATKPASPAPQGATDV
jgi:hypothetical protein